MPRKSKVWYLLLLVPFLLLIMVGTYNSIDPVIMGLPFFYWFQLLLIPVSSIVIGIVYKIYKT